MFLCNKVLQDELSSLKSFINYQSEVSNYISKTKRSGVTLPFDDFHWPKMKEINYSSHIITLYGLFERFIENAILKYLESYSKIIKNYNDFPDVIKDNNLKKTISILQTIDYPKYKNFKAKDILNILSLNLNTDSPTLFNESFSQHTSNLRINTISELFNGININIKNLNHYSPIKDHLNLEYEKIENQKYEYLYQILNDLADRRNDIAHGVENIEILHMSVINDYISFISHFCNSLIKLLQNEILKTQFDRKSIELDQICTYGDHILCINLLNKTINKDDKIIIKRIDKYPEYIVSNILDLQIDSCSYKRISSTDINYKVGIKLDKKIKKTNTFRLYRN